MDYSLIDALGRILVIVFVSCGIVSLTFFITLLWIDSCISLRRRFRAFWIRNTLTAPPPGGSYLTFFVTCLGAVAIGSIITVFAFWLLGTLL